MRVTRPTAHVQHVSCDIGTHSPRIGLLAIRSKQPGSKLTDFPLNLCLAEPGVTVRHDPHQPTICMHTLVPPSHPGAQCTESPRVACDRAPKCRCLASVRTRSQGVVGLPPCHCGAVIIIVRTVSIINSPQLAGARPRSKRNAQCFLPCRAGVGARQSCAGRTRLFQTLVPSPARCCCSSWWLRLVRERCASVAHERLPVKEGFLG